LIPPINLKINESDPLKITPQFTCPWQVQEPKETYQPAPLITKRATVLTAVYPPLKSDPGSGAWRHIPWINLRGFWLEEAGFTIGTTYTITAYDKQLIFTAE